MRIRPPSVQILAKKSRKLLDIFRKKKKKNKTIEGIITDEDYADPKDLIKEDDDDYAEYQPLKIYENPDYANYEPKKNYEDPDYDNYEKVPIKQENERRHDLAGALPTVGKPQLSELQSKLQLRKQKTIEEIECEINTKEVEDDYSRFETNPIYNSSPEVPPDLPPRRLRSTRSNQSDTSTTSNLLNKRESNSLTDLSVKRLIEKFEETGTVGEVTLRREVAYSIKTGISVVLNRSGDESGEKRRDSDELSALLEQLAKVTFAPLREPGQTISLPLNEAKKQHNTVSYYLLPSINHA